ncbi:hypothetical protein F511_30606 [Dorcoceras hygrometricum]|uniref:Uncharacterized protein n=1 Tax=Dorcoceras hygrometricum TaxID=472368 RepID=A0A2Z7C8W8_9LAMI|nr:hypothetical protein F511_30606 [Dorcoceras hygrometricum]
MNDLTNSLPFCGNQKESGNTYIINFREPLTQLRALVSQISTERVQTRNDSDRLQGMLLMEVRSLEKKITEMLILNRTTSIGLDDIRKDVDETKVALSNAILDFHSQEHENYNNLSSQLGELVAYINRGNDKKGEESSSRRPQPPPDDRNRPSGGSASRGGGSGDSGRRYDRRGSSTKRGSGSSGAGGPYKMNAEWWLYGKNQF